jgi:hypothetical protein
MGVEVETMDNERITIRITDDVSNESLVEFMSIYFKLLSSLKQREHKRILHVFIGSDTSMNINPMNMLALYRFLHYKCKKLNKAHLDSIVLYMSDKYVLNLVNGFSTLITPVVPIRFYHLSTHESKQMSG